jgi:hypothetical protein
MNKNGFHCFECGAIFAVRCPHCQEEEPFVISRAAIVTTYQCSNLDCGEFFNDSECDTQACVCEDCEIKKVAYA